MRDSGRTFAVWIEGRFDWQSMPIALYLSGSLFMPTRNVNLPKALDRFVASRVKSGSYANASEVMRTALRLLEKEEREYEEKLAALRTAIQEGLDSGVAEEGVSERLYAYIDELAAKETAQQGAQEEDCRRTA
jgi:antitoxin ParD1/3/4